MKKGTTAVALLLGLLGSTSGPAHARTWYVNASGTGDAPTIAAALDSAAAGDTVLVGPGEYATSGHTIGADVIVASEMGPLQTRVVAQGPGEAPGIFSLLFRAELHGFWLTGAYVSQIFTGVDCTISNNIVLGAPGFHITAEDPCEISNNLFLGSVGSGILAGHPNAIFLNNIIYCPIQCTTPPPMACNNILSPTTPCLEEILMQPGNGNFSADPQFCGMEGSDNYFLQSDSPCAPGNTPQVLQCGLVGPLPVGCSTVNTQETSWGEIKAMYKE